jgi:hypothetical protein
MLPQLDRQITFGHNAKTPTTRKVVFCPLYTTRPIIHRMASDKEIIEELKVALVTRLGSKAIDDLDTSRIPSPEMFLRRAAALDNGFSWNFHNPTRAENLYGEMIMAEKKTAYVYMPQFPLEDPLSEPASIFINNCYTVLKALEEDGPEEWVFDFRGHSGGLIYIFMSFAGLFIRGEYVVKFKSLREGSKIKDKMVFKDGKMDLFSGKTLAMKVNIAHYGEFSEISEPVYILVDELTGSCGELMAVILRHNLVNSNIYGKPTIGALSMPFTIHSHGFTIMLPRSVVFFDGVAKLKIDPEFPAIPKNILDIIP